MTLQQRIDVLVRLGEYMQKNDHAWQATKERAMRENPWFIEEFIETASHNIINEFLRHDKLEAWTRDYRIADEVPEPRTVGVVMAGNIPLVGFHDMLCVFISGHRQMIKTSAKDTILIQHLLHQMVTLEPAVATQIQFGERIAGCDAYIATGSNNSGRYFEAYFGKYPHIIRLNRTSVAVVDGSESVAELEALADDIQMYFGLGCRNVTKLYVPKNYDFQPLLQAFNKYEHYADFHKYKHNYDYQLALLMMGSIKYMTNGTVLLTENAGLFTAVSRINYEHYESQMQLNDLLKRKDIQCVVGHNATPFGTAQSPHLTDFADGVDTLAFALGLQKQSN